MATIFSVCEQQSQQNFVAAWRPDSLRPSKGKRTSAHKRTSFPSSVRRNTGPGDRFTDADEVASDEEAFRSGLKRNIVHLSNVARFNQAEIAKLREQLQAKDAELAALKDHGYCNQANQEMGETLAQQQAAQEQDLRPAAKATASSQQRQMATYGHVAIFAGRMAAVTRQALKARGGHSEINTMEMEVSTAALGAKQTEQQLLRDNRELRGQLERALQEAEAHRIDKKNVRARADLAAKDKAELKARLACVSDELKLQAAPLTALQLELTQARLDTEKMRERLKDARKENRQRNEESEKVNLEAQQRIGQLEFNLTEATKTCQRESLKAFTYEGMFNDVSKATRALKEEVEQRKADARIIAQELTRIQTEDGTPARLSGSTLASAMSCSGGDGAGGGKEGDGAAKGAQEKTSAVEVATLKTEVQELKRRLAQSESAKMEQFNAHCDTTKSIGLLKETIGRLGKEKAKADSTRQELSQLCREKAQEKIRALKAMTERVDKLNEDNSRLRILVNQQAERRHQLEEQREQLKEEEALRRPQVQSERAQLCRTVDELFYAEEATELALTCLRCTQLFRDPHIMTPCGHTLCAACCGSGTGGDSDSKPISDGRASGGANVQGRRTEALTEAPTSLTCCLCEEDQGEVGTKLGPRAVAPNRAVAALVGKFTFRRQLLGVLRQRSNEL